MILKFIIITNIFLSLLYAQKSNTELLGDIFRVIIPLGAYSTTLYLDDDEGEIEFYKSLGTTVGVTYTLKYSVKKERPNSEDYRSFPSGHTSATFGSASFIHIRYGLKYAILPYIASAYTGYSRVYSDQHYSEDVIAGALIGVISSWYFTSSYKDINIEPLSRSGYNGVKLSYFW